MLPVRGKCDLSSKQDRGTPRAAAKAVTRSISDYVMPQFPLPQNSGSQSVG